MNKEELEKEIEATVRELPQKPPEHTVETMLSRGLLNSDALVYKIEFVNVDGTNHRQAVCCCTACGASWSTDYRKEHHSGCSWRRDYDVMYFWDPQRDAFVGNNCEFYCPHCKNKLITRHTSDFYGSKFRLDCHKAVSIHNVQGHICILVWEISKNCDKNGTVDYSSHQEEGQLLIGKKAVRVTGLTRWYGGTHTRWERRKRFDDHCGKQPAAAIIPFDREILFSTDARNSAIEDYIDYFTTIYETDCRLTAYLRMWAKYPQVENLVRQGYCAFVLRTIEHCTNTRGYYYNAVSTFRVNDVKKFINIKEKRPHLMLGIEKNEVHLAKRLPFDMFNIYRLARKIDGIKLSESSLDLMHAHKSRLAGYAEFFNKKHNGYQPKVLSTVNYILRQVERVKKGNELINLQYLTDYWDMMFQVCEVMEPSLLYPKNLIKAHDDMQKRVKEKADEILSKKIHLQAEKHIDLCFTDDELGLMIFPCDSHADLINEGNKLDHCVARYAESVANGSTCILFIRKTSAPDKPFFTLEYKNGYVVQNRGKKNCARTAQVQQFENKWLEHIKNGGKKNVKRNNAQKQQRAGA